MRIERFCISTEHAIVLTDVYNRLVIDNKWASIREPLITCMTQKDTLERSIIEQFEMHSGGENIAVAFGDCCLVCLTGKYGTIGIFKYHYRKKVMMIAPDAVWVAGPESDYEKNMIKWLIKNKYVDASQSVTSFNLEHSVARLWT